MKRIAIVHDYLTQAGGAELLTLALAKAFPEAPIFTSVYQPEGTYPEFKDHDVRTTFLQRIVPEGKFRFAAPFFGTAFAHMDLSGFDAVVVSSSGFAHHIKHPNAFIYCHTPPHFIYDLSNYTSNSFLRTATSTLLPILRISDQSAAQRHTKYVANSKQTQKRIKAVYDKDVGVIYPPFGTAHLPTELTDSPPEPRALIVARLMAYKRIDIAIEACEIAQVPLTIVGKGPDENRLRLLAGRMTTFAGRLSNEDTAKAFASHSVVLMPGLEDFGFAPLDANYSGRPIVAFAAGGSLETVNNHVNGILVQSQDPRRWADAIKFASAESWSPSKLRRSSERFSHDRFTDEVHDWVYS